MSSTAKVVDKTGTRSLSSSTLQTPNGGTMPLRSLPTVVTVFLDYLGKGSATTNATIEVAAEDQNGPIKSTTFNESGQPSDEDIVVVAVRA